MIEERENLNFEQAETLVSEWLKVERDELTRVLEKWCGNLNKAGDHWQVIWEEPQKVELYRRKPVGEVALPELGYRISVSETSELDRSSRLMVKRRRLAIEKAFHQKEDQNVSFTVGENATGHELPASATPIKRGKKRVRRND